MANDLSLDLAGSGLVIVLVLLAILFWLATTAFWLWMLIDCIKNEGDAGNNRVVWAVLMVVLGPIVSILYYFIRRPQRIAEFGR